MALVYFIPGTMCDERVWSKLWPHLATDNQLIHLSLINSGSLQDVVANLLKQIHNHSEGCSFSLVGFSLGGYLAAAVSLHFTSQLERLMLIANTPIALPEEEYQQRQRILKSIGSEGYNGLSSARILSFLDISFHGDNALIEMIKAMEKNFKLSDLKHHLDELSKREDLCDLLAQQNIPTWLCYGVSDQLVDRKKMQRMQKSSNSIILKQILHCGHFLPLEQPEQLALQIRQWLKMSKELADKKVIVGLIDPKSPSNVGAVMRAAGCYSADAVYYSGLRYDRAARFNTDTKQMTDKIPLQHVEDFSQFKTAKRQLICVDLIEGAIPLPEFEHPEHAIYIFGPEDSSVDQSLVDIADAVVYVPTQGCMNLAASVNVLLYDRMAKSKVQIVGDELIRRSRDINNNVKVKC
ncbi:MAG: alpha/beta fold hydrolase [Oceanospirillaceae bacterium]|nr:alpha/beta fold hydrolase [Oceanospirillaceae bacterium]